MAETLTAGGRLMDIKLTPDYRGRWVATISGGLFVLNDGPIGFGATSEEALASAIGYVQRLYFEIGELLARPRPQA